MTFQAYLDTIKAKTGLTPADFAKEHKLGYSEAASQVAMQGKKAAA